MKKLMMAAIGLMMAVSANAQYLNDSGTPFEEGKFYVAASFSNTTLAYNKLSDLAIDINGKAGYFFIDNLMGIGVIGYKNEKKGDIAAAMLGVGARWYFDKVGIYVGGIAAYVHQKEYGVSFDDFQPEVHGGYAFFLGGHVTLEPEVYYRHSFKDSDYSEIGARIGIGIYF